MLAEGLALGVCGTDKEIARGEYGLAGTGRHQEARALFDRLLDLRNDVGLLSEKYDPATGRQVGNTPQAFSMVGLINSARQLTGSHTTTSASRERQHLDPHRERPSTPPLTEPVPE
ncbi:glycoside hydrolase family 15 protein [Actinophytocola algeriensis]|uniref:GH15-like domain-containing protein n=1 Tax=Actinophytocola algeriensis TaxID=1768010 RepID=A0A7W7VJM9_9PSEU|nr:glycoside hydrolase family 15 protein [Actinophytocola algeriensis]MBB4912736.1 hypothetical protein [Actinophytocola algeriensis]MBE1473596.1 hypothetical protein [Actinophytocola algeriensis]